MTDENANPETGALTTDDLAALMSAPEPVEAEPTEKQEAEEAEEVEEAKAEESEGESDDAPEEEQQPEEGDTGDDEESEEPQHIPLDEYGDITTTIRVNGEDVTASLSELAAGYSRESDYRKKTTLVAEERKELQRRASEVEELRRQLDARLAEQVESEPDWDALYEKDPIEFAKVKHDWEQKRKAVDQARERQFEQMRAQRVEYARRTAEKAVELIPEWAEPGKAAEGAKARREVALAAGFTDEEYDQAIDGRLAVVLHWAALGRQSVKGQRKALDLAKKKVAKAPKVVKPGTTKTAVQARDEKRAAVEKRLQRSGAVDDLAEWMLS